MNLPEILFLTLFVALAPLVGYQFILSLLALNAKLQTRFESEYNRKFALVVPAHNEEKIISKTIYSLSGLIYPKSNYDIFVIADNCTDNTANLASSLGVTVLERNNHKKKGKGYALRWAFDQILGHQKAYDAIIVVDADSLISGNYLEVMNYYLDQGSRVIQSSDLVLPEPGNWSIESTRIGFLLHNYVKPLGRKVLNLNMGLRGNGMCFRTDVLTEVPWKAWSLTEDLEYGLILLLNGIKIDFAPEATVYAQMPVEAKNAETQRSRWELGRLQIIRMYTSKFLKEAYKKRSAAFFDVFIDLITPPFVNMMLLVMISLFSVFGLWLFGVVATYHLYMWLMLALIGIVYFFTGMYVAGADRNLYKSLLHLPVYVVWKIKVYVNAYRKGKEVDWIRTERDS
ncbi:MAG: glycosyltransferase family 2 protein [Balneolaceae bacterium]|nr:glycosyltransferase family 2 protein [Balneolaceae bacterium]